MLHGLFECLQSGRKKVYQGKASDGGRVAIFGERHPGSLYTPDSYSPIRRGQMKRLRGVSPRLIGEFSSISESQTQGVGVGGAHRHLACRLLLFARYALGYFLMALQAIFTRDLLERRGMHLSPKLPETRFAQLSGVFLFADMPTPRVCATRRSPGRGFWKGVQSQLSKARCPKDCLLEFQLFNNSSAALFIASPVLFLLCNQYFTHLIWQTGKGCPR